jgi:hypothetical protein
VPLQGARPTDAQQPASSPTSSAAQRALTAATVPASLAGEARATPRTVVAANDPQLRALDAATDSSAAAAKKAKHFSVGSKFAKLGAEIPAAKWYALDKVGLKLGIADINALGAKATKSFLGFMAALPLAYADWRANRNAGQQAAQYQAGAAQFEARCREMGRATSPEDRAAARGAMYGTDRASAAGEPREVAQAWLKHKEASKKSNLVGVGLGVSASLQSATETSMNIASEAGKKAKEKLLDAIPGVGIAGAVVGLATSAHALKKQNAVRGELNAQREQLAAAANIVQNSRPEGMGGALSNVLKHSQARLEIRTTANHIQMAGSGLAIAGSSVALAGNVATLTGVGAAAGAALAVTSMALSLMSLCASLGATLYEYRKTSQDAGEKSAITPDQLETRFQDRDGKPLEGKALALAKAELAGANKFYALVLLAEKLQTAEPGSKDFGDAEALLNLAGLSKQHVSAIIVLARANDGPVSINSGAVNELAKALYGAPVGQVTAKPAAAAEAPLQAPSRPTVKEEASASFAAGMASLQFHDPSVLRV